MSRSYLEFRCSELGDFSWNRTLSTLALKEYKEIVSNRKLIPRKNEYGIMYNWTMVGISMVFKPRALLGFHPNPRFLESRVGKTLNGTRV